MIDWLFKRKKKEPAPEAPAKAAPPVARAPAAAPAPPDADWQARLDEAAGDDDLLLALAASPAPLDVRLAAVDALASVEALKRAERDLRKHDSRIHRRAKRRHAELLAQRDARRQAAELTAKAQALLREPLIAANRLVELDRAWRALDPQWLDSSQTDEFAAIFERLTALVRERADDALQAERFAAAAQGAAAELRSACGQAAAGTIDHGALAAASAQAQALLDAAPHDTDRAAAPYETLRAALRDAGDLAPRLAVLETLARAPARRELPAAAEPAGGDAACAPSGEAESDTPADVADNAAGDALAQATADALERWRAFAPLADPGLAQALASRFSQWQRAQRRASPPAPSAAPAASVAAQDDGARLDRLSRSIEQAQAALAQGNLAAAGAPLAAIDAALRDGPVPAALRAGIDELHAEAARLRGWQQWGGARARDELVAQAEALAAADTGAPDADVARMTTRQRAALIGEMRARWKELDRHGGASGRVLWQRFDAALNAAHAPVAAQAQAQREARELNLQARIALLVTLEAVALPCDAEPAVAPGAAAPAAAASDAAASDAAASDAAIPDAAIPDAAIPDAAIPDAAIPDSATHDAATPEAAAAPRAPAAALGSALAGFHAAWRKLGPLEHTVPRAAREALKARIQAAVARIETPLVEARRMAQTQREALIASARALAAAGAARDSLDQARALQARWQDAARSLPLARAVENALWADFRTAIDSIYGARQAELAARDAAFEAGLDEREALIARLAALTPDDAPDTIRRTLAEADDGWKQAGAAPRAEAAALEARWRHARDAARLLLTEATQRRWRAQCDALAARLDERDRTPAAGAIENAEPAMLPPRWERALAQAGAGPAADPLSDDDLLLQLEAALGIDSPPAFEAARRALKLQAMKAALETRTPDAARFAADDLLVAALARASFDAAQRARLRAAITAMRDAAPSGAA